MSDRTWIRVQRWTLLILAALTVAAIVMSAVRSTQPQREYNGRADWQRSHNLWLQEKGE
jgi:Na+(H+)/acetate symporter ActP